MLKTLGQFLKNPLGKRKIDDSDDFDDDDDDDDSVDRYVARPIGGVVQDDEQGQDDMRDWTKIVPNNNDTSRSRQQQQQRSPQRQRARGPGRVAAVDTQQPMPSFPLSTIDDFHVVGPADYNTGEQWSLQQQQQPQNRHHQQQLQHDAEMARQLQRQEQERQQQQQQERQPRQPIRGTFVAQPQRPVNAFFQTPTIASTDMPVMQQRISVWQQQRQMQHSQLSRSIRKTYSEIKRDHPNQVEQDEINRAVELSMLDFAVVPQKSQGNNKIAAFQNARPPHVILGVAEDATRAEIKTAYRKLARLHHPDKTGGDSTRFDEILKAYKAMMALSVSSHETSGSSDPFMVHDKDASADVAARLKSTAHWDQELQDHRRLVNDLFQADGMDLQACVDKQLNALELLGLAFKDAGATNRNEKDEIITNSCFYLSLAVSRLWGIGVLNFDNAEKKDGVDDDLDTIMAESETELNEMMIGDTALDFKRGIEASVVKAHPEWAAQGKVGEEVQAFSDFLVYVLDSLMAECAVVVFDTTSGFCDIYKGKFYDKLAASTPETAQANTLTVRYIPGHYQPLIPSRKDARRPMLQDIVSALDNYGILYAITGGN